LTTDTRHIIAQRHYDLKMRQSSEPELRSTLLQLAITANADNLFAHFPFINGIGGAFHSPKQKPVLIPDSGAKRAQQGFSEG
jgi:hypothetical protein